jgi:hypothetical protein
MNNNFLFAIDKNTEEIIISISEETSNKIKSIGRISRINNEILYQAVTTLSLISNSTNFDVNLFSKMDNICQEIYKKHA